MRQAVDPKKAALIVGLVFLFVMVLIRSPSTSENSQPSPTEKNSSQDTKCQKSAAVQLQTVTEYEEAKKIAISRPPPNRVNVSDTNYGKSAMIWAGNIGTALQHADQIRNHLLDPNDMDIYVFIDKKSALLSRYGEKDTRDPEAHLIESWGNRLRGLWFLEEDIGFRMLTPFNYAQNELRLTALESFMEKYKSKGLNTTEKLEGALYWDSGISSYPYSHRWNWWAIDQYSRLQRLAQLARPLILERAYERVFRFRADVEFLENAIITDLEIKPNRVYVVPHTGGTVTETWLAEPKLSLDLAENFMEFYLKFVPNVFRHSDRTDKNDVLYWVLAPQSTFMQMVRRIDVEVESLCYEYQQVDSRMDSYKTPIIKTMRFVKQLYCSVFHPYTKIVDDYIAYKGGEFVELPPQ